MASSVAGIGYRRTQPVVFQEGPATPHRCTSTGFIGDSVTVVSREGHAKIKNIREFVGIGHYRNLPDIRVHELAAVHQFFPPPVFKMYMLLLFHCLQYIHGAMYQLESFENRTFTRKDVDYQVIGVKQNCPRYFLARV